MQGAEETASLKHLRQGDVVKLDWIPAVIDGEPGAFQTPCGVVLISQTCDIVQNSPSKLNVLVAPRVCSPTAAQLSLAKSGSAPLTVYLPPLGDGPAGIADIQRAASVPKASLEHAPILAHHANAASSLEARNLAERLGRVYSRFAFPDEVVPVLDKMKRKARKAAAGSGAFGRVLDHVDLRVSANHWDKPNRILYLYVVVTSSVLILSDDADPEWSWQQATIVGKKAQEQVPTANLTRISDLLAQNCDSHIDDPVSSNATTLLRLWGVWVDRFREELLDSQVNSEVAEFRVELVSDAEFPVLRWRETVSLDLEDLSDSTLATASRDNDDT